MDIECGPSCKFADKCINKKFQMHQYAQLELLDSPPKGKGIFAKQNIKADDFIIEYVGEVIGDTDLHERLEKYSQAKYPHHYILSTGARDLPHIDSTQSGNVARYINHSCNPNCRPRLWIVLGCHRMGNFALTNIKKGEEITYNYGFKNYG